MDAIDLRILAALQRDASGSVSEVAERAGVSQTPAWKRIKRLEQAGVIKKRVVVLDADALNLKLVGYVQVRTSQHTDAWLKRFAAAIQKIPEVVECHRMAGDIDYLLKVVAPDMAGYDAIYKNLIRLAELSDVSASFSMEQIKQTTELPLSYALTSP
jgi:Lrp/AsnC family transcriptional regulator